MAAPSITLGTAYNTETESASHSVNLPSGTAYKGVWIATLSSTAHTINTPTDWTVVQSTAISSTRRLTFLRSNNQISATSIAITGSVNTEAAAFGFSTDGDLPNVVSVTGATGSSTTPDPPSTGTITSGDYRVFPACAYMDARRDVNGYPTNYADNQATTKAGTANNSPGIGVASRGLTSITSEDPGTFSLSASLAWAAGTVAIPAATAVTGSGAVTLQNSTSAGTGVYTPPPITGSGTPSLQNTTSAGTGTHTAPSFTGSGTPTLQNTTSAGSGALGENGSGAAQLEDTTVAGTGVFTSPPISGSGAVTLEDTTSTGSGALGVNGSGAADCEDTTVSGTGVYTPPPISGSGAVDLEDTTSSGTGTYTPPPITGSGSVALEDSASAGTGSFFEGFTGTGAPTLENTTVAGSGTFTPPPISGSGAAQLEDTISTGTGALGVNGSGASTLEDTLVSGSGTFTAGAITGSGAVQLEDTIVSGVGVISGVVTVPTATVTDGGPRASVTSEVRVSVSGVRRAIVTDAQRVT